MWLLIWIIQSFLNAIWMIFWKKVVENKSVGNNWQTLFSRWNHILIIGILFFFWFFEYKIPQNEINYFNIWLLIIATFALYITYPLRRIAYANEKITVLQPFAMLFQVFPVIIWFIFISTERNNIITFLSSIIASIIVILSSIDFKKFKFNKYSMMVLISSCIKSIQVFAALYFLSFLSPTTFYFSESIIVIIYAILLIIIKKEFKQIKLLTKKYSKLLIITNTIVICSILLSLTMYKNLWVITTSLLSLLYLLFIYILWYFILKDIPSKKNILVTVIVSILIIIWVLYKS